MGGKAVNVKAVLITLEHEQIKELQAIKKRQGVPVSESVRRAVKRYLKAESRK